MHRNRLTRRSLTIGSVLAAPTLVPPVTSLAQTPAATPDANKGHALSFERNVLALSPDELVTMLEQEHFQAPWIPLPAEFEPEPLETDESPYDSSVANIAIVFADSEPGDRGRTLGVYVVMAEKEDARSAFEVVTKPPENADWTTVPLMIGGLEGVQQVSDHNNGDAMLLVGNVMIVATDAFFSDGARTNPDTAIIRTTYNMTAMLDHLRSVTRPGN